MYVYIEYPKCLYQGEGQTLVVNDKEEEDNAATMGWLTAEQFYSPAVVAKAEEPVVNVESEEKYEEDETVG